MTLRKIVAGFGFLAALALGVAAAWVGGGWAQDTQVVPAVEMPVAESERARIRMGMFVGKWAGKWDHDFSDCTLDIDRVSGNNFYGTLKMNAARIAFTGTIDRETGKVTIRETKVLSLGNYAWWSLGENTGTISADRLSMSGTGRDKNGEYNWYVSLASSLE